jgi:accessory colonization factor AcfC
MSFHKRFLREESIRSYAQNDFQSFKIYMTNADAYIVESGWAHEIFKKFDLANEEERKLIHQTIKNEN